MLDERIPYRFFILFPLVAMTVLFGGARPWLWGTITGVFFVALSIWIVAATFLSEKRPVAPSAPIPRVALFACAILIAYPLLQIFPLPMAMVTIFSPVRGEWAQMVYKVSGSGLVSISYEPLITFYRFLWWVFLAVYAAFIWQETTRLGSRIPTWLMTALFLLAGAEALYGILQTLIPSLGVLWDVGRVTGRANAGYARGTFINRDHFAAFLGLLWPVLFAYILVLRSPRKMEYILSRRERSEILAQKKLFAIYCLGLVILGLVFSQSRGGIVTSILSFTLLCLFAGIRNRRILLALAACWIIMIGYGSIIGFEGIISRFCQIEQGAYGRLEIWKDGWSALMDHKLTGTGLGTYPRIARVYQNAFPPGVHASHAHNDYLEASVEMGLPMSLILVCAIWGLWWRQAFRLWRQRETIDRDTLLLASGTLAALGGYLLHSWAEFNNAIPANQMTAVLVAVLHFSFFASSRKSVKM